TIWIFNLDFFMAECQPPEYDLTSTTPPKYLNASLDYVTAPTSTNPNLRAQQGVFTIWRPNSIHPQNNICHDSLDDLVKNAYTELGREPNEPIFFKFSLEYDKLPALWTVIKRNGINTASMFPDFNGSALAVLEDADFF
ncbi:MAG: hypothetical protein ACF8OB_09120, partial [Phycisphaeraceae bacterium JB051]